MLVEIIIIIIIMLVETVCGSVLASGYTGLLTRALGEAGVDPGAPVIMVVFGGNIVNTTILSLWRQCKIF